MMCIGIGRRSIICMNDVGIFLDPGFGYMLYVMVLQSLLIKWKVADWHSAIYPLFNAFSIVVLYALECPATSMDMDGCHCMHDDDDDKVCVCVYKYIYVLDLCHSIIIKDLTIL